MPEVKDIPKLDNLKTILTVFLTEKFDFSFMDHNILANNLIIPITSVLYSTQCTIRYLKK